jgi:peptidylprolyl isomerase
MEVKDGSTVHVEYKLALDDGSVIDTNEGKDPLPFTIGQKQVILGFENGVKGMKVDEEKDIVVPAEEGYGVYNEALVQEVPKDMFKDFTPTIGQMIGLMGKQGEKLQAKVVGMSDDKVKLNLNHPLAGKTLHFHVKVVKIE